MVKAHQADLWGESPYFCAKGEAETRTPIIGLMCFELERFFSSSHLCPGFQLKTNIAVLSEKTHGTSPFSPPLSVPSGACGWFVTPKEQKMSVLFVWSQHTGANPVCSFRTNFRTSFILVVNKFVRQKFCVGKHPTKRPDEWLFSVCHGNKKTIFEVRVTRTTLVYTVR